MFDRKKSVLNSRKQLSRRSFADFTNSVYVRKRLGNVMVKRAQSVSLAVSRINDTYKKLFPRTFKRDAWRGKITKLTVIAFGFGPRSIIVEPESYVSAGRRSNAHGCRSANWLHTNRRRREHRVSLLSTQTKSFKTYWFHNLLYDCGGVTGVTKNGKWRRVRIHIPNTLRPVKLD